MSEIKPALTAKEWRLALQDGGPVDDYDVELEHTARKWGESLTGGDGWEAHPRTHGLAALCLYGQPFGFPREDVPNLRVIADFLDLLAKDKTAEMHARLERVLSGAKLRDIADRIEALLPPEKP